MPAATKTDRAAFVDVRIKAEKQGSTCAGPLSAAKRALVELLTLRANLITAPRHPVHDGNARSIVIVHVAQTTSPHKRAPAKTRLRALQPPNAAKQVMVAPRVVACFPTACTVCSLSQHPDDDLWTVFGIFLT